MTHLGYNTNSADPVQMPQNAASDEGLLCLLLGICMLNTMKVNPETRNGLIQMIRMDKYTGQKFG